MPYARMGERGGKRVGELIASFLPRPAMMLRRTAINHHHRTMNRRASWQASWRTSWLPITNPQHASVPRCPGVWRATRQLALSHTARPGADPALARPWRRKRVVCFVLRKRNGRGRNPAGQRYVRKLDPMDGDKRAPISDRAVSNRYSRLFPSLAGSSDREAGPLVYLFLVRLARSLPEPPDGNFQARAELSGGGSSCEKLPLVRRRLRVK